MGFDKDGLDVGVRVVGLLVEAGLLVGLFETGFSEGFLVGLFETGFCVGILAVVGLAVTLGFFVGLFETGFCVGFLV